MKYVKLFAVLAMVLYGGSMIAAVLDDANAQNRQGGQPYCGGKGGRRC